MNIEHLFQTQLENKTSLRASPVKERIEKLNKILNWILANRKRVKEALYNDFRKPHVETDLTEIYPLLSELRHIKRNLVKWTKKKKVNRTLSLITHSGYINYEAKGSVLIISPWNYPFLLSVGPIISAIAAGNTIFLKPSEISENTSLLLQEMFNELFEKQDIVVVTGGKEIASQLLSLSFDHIFFTGSTEVGKIVAKSAAKNLTSVTLELGGKSPVIVDSSANLKLAAEKIIWGKFINKGQTCIAPDYILVEKSKQESFVSELIDKIKLYYGVNGNEVENNLNYARVINDKHFEHLSTMKENVLSNKGQILYGGKFDKDNHFIEPTIILTNCKDCKISEEEIFGPLLPIVEYSSIEEAIDWINKRTSPLAIYIFSDDSKAVEDISISTQSGGVGINEVVLQFSHQNLPFGGVKESGIGKTHGFAGFKEFSNERSYIKAGKISLLKIIYPPYNKRKNKIIDFLVKYF